MSRIWVSSKSWGWHVDITPGFLTGEESVLREDE